MDSRHPLSLISWTSFVLSTHNCVGADGTKAISGNSSLSAAAQLHRYAAGAISAIALQLVLGQSADAEETLRQAAQRVDQIADPTMQANLMAASGILAGLRLGDEVIYRILRRDIMQESTVYRSIWREAEEEKTRAIALNFLREGLSVETIARGTGLSLEEVQQLQQQLNDSAQS